MSLPQKLPYELMLTQWASQLNPVISNPIVQGVLISNITLKSGKETVIPTTLSRKQLGWFLVDNTANAVLFRTQPFNSQNLTLKSSADTVISIWMF